MKPNPKFFEQILDRLDIDPTELLFIDDNATNVDAATSARINAAIFRALDHLNPVASLAGMIGEYGVRL